PRRLRRSDAGSGGRRRRRQGRGSQEKGGSEVDSSVRSRPRTRYSCRSASIGSISAARYAGYRPNETPTTSDVMNDAPTDIGVTIGLRLWIVGGSTAHTSGNPLWRILSNPSVAGKHRKPQPTPTRPPIAVSEMLSARNW